jgi:hypothetical protein
MTEPIINRIRMLLGYLPVTEIRAKFPDLNEDTFWLAYRAALQMEKSNV